MLRDCIRTNAGRKRGRAGRAAAADGGIIGGRLKRPGQGRAWGPL